MRPIRSTLIACGCAVLVQAQPQPTPEAFLALLPGVPAGICAAKAPERRAFTEKLQRILDQMDEQIRQTQERERSASEAGAEALARQVRASAPSKAEREKLKGMSKEEKMAWAMAQAQAMDPAAMQALAAAGQAAQEAAALAPEARARFERIARLKDRYESLAAEFRVQLRGAAGRSYSSRLGTVAPVDCAKASAKYSALLGEHLAALKAALPDYRRQAQAAALAAGRAKDSACSVEALEEIRDYAARLGDVYAFGGGAE